MSTYYIESLYNFKPRFPSSVTAFAVRLRSAEISIRKAVGAGLSDVIRLVLGQNLWTILAGLGTGLAVALASGTCPKGD